MKKKKLAIVVTKKPQERPDLADRVPSMGMARFRALMHQAWIAGNESYNLPHEAAGLSERQDFIDSVCERENFVKTKE